MYSVLMVDDNAAMREALARSLTRRGCRVTTAASGVEGLQALQERSFDIVITDLNMPERVGATAGAAQLVALHGDRAIHLEAAVAGYAVASGGGSLGGYAAQYARLAGRATGECGSRHAVAG